MTAPGAQLATSYTEAVTVDIGDGPHAHIAYSASTGAIWVLNGRDRSASILDGGTAQPRARIDLGGEPRHLIIDDKADRAYIPVREDALVVIRLSTGEIEKRVEFEPGTSPNVLVPQAPLDRIYVLGDDGACPIVSVSGLSVDKTITVGARPAWGQPHKEAFGRVHVTNFEDGTVSVISDDTAEVVATVPVGKGPNRNAVYRERNSMYSANLGDNTLTGISVLDHAVIGTVQLDIDPFRLVPAEKKTGRPEIWVLGRGNENDPGGIRTVDASTHTVSASLETVEHPANWLFEGSIGQVVSQRTREMAVVDTRTRSVVGAARLSHDPDLDCLSNMVFGADHGLFLCNADNTVTLLRPTS